MPNISKFGVPIGGTKLGMLHPKQQWKYRAIFLGMGFNADSRVVTQNVVTVQRPSVEHAITEVHSYNSVAYVQGKHSWQTVEMTIRDDISNGVVSVIGQQIQKQMNHFEQTQAVAGANYKFDAEIHSLDGTNGEELDSWELCGCFISNYTTPVGDYASSDANQITITIRYDNAVHVAGPNTNDGTTVGGDPFPNLPSPGGSANIG